MKKLLSVLLPKVSAGLALVPVAFALLLLPAAVSEPVVGKLDLSSGISQKKVPSSAKVKMEAAAVEVFPSSTHDNFSVAYSVPAYSLVTIDLVDTKGQLVEHLLNHLSPAGKFQSTFEISEQYVPSHYLIKTTIGEQTSYSPLIILE